MSVRRVFPAPSIIGEELDPYRTSAATVLETYQVVSPNDRLLEGLLRIACGFGLVVLGLLWFLGIAGHLFNINPPSEDFIFFGVVFEIVGYYLLWRGVYVLKHRPYEIRIRGRGIVEFRSVFTQKEIYLSDIQLIVTSLPENATSQSEIQLLIRHRWGKIFIQAFPRAQELVDILAWLNRHIVVRRLGE